jgi:hypothetical protein
MVQVNKKIITIIIKLVMISAEICVLLLFIVTAIIRIYTYTIGRYHGHVVYAHHVRLWGCCGGLT